MDITKVCRGCGEEKPLEAFVKSSTSKNGRRHLCKVCAAVQLRAYRIKHPDKFVVYEARRRDRNPDRYKEYYRQHREERLAYCRRYREEHREDFSEYEVRYYWANRERELAANRRYHAECGDKVREQKRRYREAHPDKIRELVQRRYQRKHASDGAGVTAEVVAEKRAEYGGICPYCNKPIGVGHLEHVTPLARGGTHTPDNLVWACETCNHRKSTRSLIAFLADYPIGS